MKFPASVYSETEIPAELIHDVTSQQTLRWERLILHGDIYYFSERRPVWNG